MAAAPPSYTLPQAHEIERGLKEPPPRMHPVRRIARAAGTAGTAVAAFLLFNNLIALFVGAPIALRYAQAAPEAVPIFVVFPVPIAVTSLGGAAAVAWHLLLIAVIAASTVHLLRRYGSDAWSKLLRALRGDGTPTLSEPNLFFVLARLWAMSLFVVILIDLIAVSVGPAPTVPSSLQNADPGALLIALAHASVWEELITRVLLLGVPLALMHLAARARLEQPGWRYVLGGGFRLDSASVPLILFQGVIFGIAHAPGWDLWKVPSATIFGVALGFLFVRYGLFACILLHFLNDYLSASITLTGSTAYPGLVLIGFYMVLGFGVVSAVRYLFVIREVMVARHVPEYLGGPPLAALPVGAPPAMAFVPAAPEPPARIDEQAAPPGGRG